jgi:hypothetical protein
MRLEGRPEDIRVTSRFVCRDLSMPARSGLRRAQERAPAEVEAIFSAQNKVPPKEEPTDA